MKYEDVIAEWENFYRGLGVSCDFSQIAIPDDPGGFGRVIIMAKGVLPQWAYDKCSGLFRCWKWTDQNLDEIVISDRTAKNGPYAIRVRDRVEADEELKSLSANDIKDKKITTETFEERLIHELKFFKETEKHLDVKNITLCAGSRYSDGKVPSVYWLEDRGKVGVSWCRPGDASGDLRSRAAVSF